MATYTKKNLRQDVENSAPKFDMPDEMDARFARKPLGGKTLGLSLFSLEPNFRIPFGHKQGSGLWPLAINRTRTSSRK